MQLRTVSMAPVLLPLLPSILLWETGFLDLPLLVLVSLSSSDGPSNMSGNVSSMTRKCGLWIDAGFSSQP